MKRMDDVWGESDVWEFGSGGEPHAKGKHYGTFPKELVRRCLEVSTSEKGYCPECGAPWQRIVERGVSSWKAVGATRERAKQYSAKTGKVDYNGAFDSKGKAVEKRMAPMTNKGWEPTCGHKRRPVRAVVADPFCGSGTTGIVTMERGDEFVGVELELKNVEESARNISAAESRR